MIMYIYIIERYDIFLNYNNDHAGVMTVFFFAFQEKYFVSNNNVNRRTNKSLASLTITINGPIL